MNIKKIYSAAFLKNKKNFSNVFLLFLIYIFGIFLLNYIYCSLYISKFPQIVDKQNIYILKNLGFNFGDIMQNLEQNGELKATYFGIDFYVSRMPALPLILNFLFKNVTTNFFEIHLIKNIFFSSLIFLLLNNIFREKNLVILLGSLLALFYNPHNLWVTLSFNFEEGILNYLIVILTLLFFCNLKYRYFYLAVTISLIYFLKSAMFFLCITMSIYFIFDSYKNKFRFLPLVLLIVSNLIWGSYSYTKTNFFAFGPKSVSFNSFTLNFAYNHQFNNVYPKVSPDILTANQLLKLPKDIEKNEWAIDKFYFDETVNFILENPKKVAVSIIKKLNIIFFYPYKDAQLPNVNPDYENPLRISSVPNKVIFIFFIFKLFSDFFKKKSHTSIFFILLSCTYFFPYIVGFVYSRHCTSIYMIASFYVFYDIFVLKNNSKVNIKI